jgi:hypothetical protein
VSDEKKKPKPGPIVEDTSVTGGHDATTGAPVIKPKGADGKADESVKPTDSREKKD